MCYIQKWFSHLLPLSTTTAASSFPLFKQHFLFDKEKVYEDGFVNAFFSSRDEEEAVEFLTQ